MTARSPKSRWAILQVDACLGGGGVWFDAFELPRVDEPGETAADLLVDVRRDPTLAVDSNQAGTELASRHRTEIEIAKREAISYGSPVPKNGNNTTTF